MDRRFGKSGGGRLGKSGGGRLGESGGGRLGESGGGRRGFVARVGTIGILALGGATVLGVAGAVPAYAANAGFTTSAQSTGLQLVLFGTTLTGGDSSACVNDVGAVGATTPVANKNADGSASDCDQQPGVFAASEGTGTLLTSSGVYEDQKASEGAAGQTDGSTTSTCDQGGGTPSGTPVLLSLGLSCAYAEAGIDTGGDPTSSAMGEVANMTIGLNGILSPILGASPSSGSADSCQSTGTVGALLNTVCTALSSLAGSSPAPASNLFSGIQQALQNLYNVVTTDADPTITIDVGQAKSSVTTSGETADATSQGSTLDVAILPGVGCAAPAGASTQPTLAQCITDEASGSPQYTAPLIEILVSPASSTSTYDGTNWTSTGTGSLATIDVNIPGAQQVISVPPNVDQTILSGTPLQTTIDLGSAQTSHSGTGATSTAQGAVVNVLQSSTFPGASSTVGAVSANLGSTGTTSTQAGTPAPTPPTSPASSPAVVPAAAPATAAITSPTAVHTGEWWSGSMPFLVMLGLFGAGLIGWPRFRKLSFVSRVLSKAHR